MFGCSKEDVENIVRSEVSRFEEKFLKEQMASDAEFAGIVNEKVKDFPARLEQALKDCAVVSAAKYKELASRVDALAADNKKYEQLIQAGTKSSAENFDLYMQRLIKLGTTVERVVCLVEAGEVNRTELVKQVVKNAENAKAHSHEALLRLDTTMAKISNIFEEQMHLSNQMLAAVKVVAKNFADVVVVEEEEEAIQPVAKKKKVSKK